MRVAALCDVHGNLPALEAVLAEVAESGADALVLGGDVASGPMPAETLDAVERVAMPIQLVRGNADRVLDLEGIPEPNRTARLWVAERLGAQRLSFLAQLPLDLTLEIEGLGRVRFCHGAPGSDTLTITKLTPAARLRALLDGVEEDVVVCGHTHVQFDRRCGGIRVVNAGSVGAPYEEEPAAYWALLGPDVEFRRTDYDVAAAVERMRETGYPNLDYLQYLVPEPGRPDRISAAIEAL